METIRWNGDSITLLDQRLLPNEETYHTYRHYHDIIVSIKELEVRGAPAIGVTTAMGIALAARNIIEASGKFQEDMGRALDAFIAARPTAVNLHWAVARMRTIVESGTDPKDMVEKLEKEAIAIFNEDVAANKALAAHGARFLASGDTVMTHCNAGALATAGYGTALGVIRTAVAEGKKIQVYACETRPLLQGARLTAWELLREGIPVTVITDNMAGHFMKAGVIQKVIVGADRIAANGDTANKIGTYTHSVLAREHRLPFYVAAPVSSIDLNTKTGAEIVIEERGVDEVAYCGGVQVVPEGVFIRNPAFDVTPAGNVTAIITERGVIEKPDAQRIAEHVKK